MIKRVLHLTFDMRIGGTEQVIKNIILGNDHGDFEMSVFCLELPIGPFGKQLIESGVVVTGVNRKQGFDFSLIKKIRSYIKKNKIDVLHCHQYTPWVYGTFSSIGLNVKVIFTEHGRFYPDRSRWKRKYINPLLLKFTQHVIAISEATRQALIDYEFIPGEHISVIYNGIIGIESDPAEIDNLKKKLGIKPDSPVIGTIARMDPIKNHLMMFEAYKQVLEKIPDCILILVGDGEERGNIEQKIATIGITDSVILTGYINNPKDYLGCMDVFLLPSLSEGTSMTLLEAMSISKPCIVTDAGGNPEIIKHKINGIVVENNNEEMFARAIIELLRDKNSLSEMSDESQKRFKQCFSIDQMSLKYKNLYQ